MTIEIDPDSLDAKLATASATQQVTITIEVIPSLSLLEAVDCGDLDTETAKQELAAQAGFQAPVDPLAGLG